MEVRFRISTKSHSHFKLPDENTRHTRPAGSFFDYAWNAHYLLASATSDAPSPLATHTSNLRNQVASTLVESGHLAAGQATEADALLPKLLLSINAIASGLRTTG